jgi:PAS domain S-box-containing protein
MKKLDFKSAEEEVLFLRKVLDSIPAIINVNQVDDRDDPAGNFNLWANRQLIDFIGYSREEISEMGFNFFQETMHPDDLELIAASLNKITSDNTPIHGGMMRLKPKDGDYQWFIGNMAVMEMKDGKPWRVVVNVQNLEQMNDTRNQILQLVRENLQLKHQLRFQSLSKREKQIVKLIAKGHTDKEIAKNLSISPATVKTHRHTIIQKMRLKNKAAIAQFATENGLD